MEMFAEHDAQPKLGDRLDESLLNHAKALSTADRPQIVQVYGLQALAEIHCYLKTVHQFDPAEVEALLQFNDPLVAASLCWEENSHEYSFPICDLLRETGAKERLPLAEPEPPKKLSVREQLRSAMKKARQQLAPAERPRGDEGR